MYNKILLTLDATPTDRVIIEHIKALAKEMHSHVVLLHVADGWAARIHGADAVSPEVTEDTAYLRAVAGRVSICGYPGRSRAGLRDPGEQIVEWVRSKSCDLVAMSTHGTALWEISFRSASRRVRHSVTVPVLLLRAKP